MLLLASPCKCSCKGVFLTGVSRASRVFRVLKQLKGTVVSKGTVAVAMSGGIDSSVAAMILKDQGYTCVGVFMRNWDSSDEAGEITCSIDRDREHMREVCRRLDIPAVDVRVSYVSPV